MKILLTGAGTGGHIYPLLAIAEKLREKAVPEFLFLGSRPAYEKEIFSREKIEQKFVPISGINRKKPHKNVAALYNYMKAQKSIGKILDEFAPDFVISTGGYISYTVMKKTSEKNIPAYMHEQNLIPGLANRMSEKFARLIFIPFEESRKYFKQGGKLVVSGNPVRSVFAERARKPEHGSPFTVLSFGGSLGSQKINNIMLSCFEKMVGKDIRFVIITGARDWENVEKIAAAMRAKLKFPDGKLTIIPYANDIIEWYEEAGLVVSRSGALTLSELIALEKPAILVPSPNVTADHQYHNAKVLADKNAAMLIRESELSAGLLQSKIESLLESSDRLKEMKRNIAGFKMRDSAETICSAILDDMARLNEMAEKASKG